MIIHPKRKSAARSSIPPIGSTRQMSSNCCHGYTRQ